MSLIAFGDRARDLLAHKQGSTLAVAGRGKLSSWIDKSGVEKHGLSVVLEQIASASAARRADAKRREARQ
jgi:single-stranded DNA-binding protein